MYLIYTKLFSDDMYRVEHRSGRIVLDGGHLTTVDEKVFLTEAQTKAYNLVRRTNILQR